MKKLILAFAVILTTVTFSSCSKENVAPTTKEAATYKLNVTADKANLGQADFSEDPTTPPAGDKANLGQADYNGN